MSLRTANISHLKENAFDALIVGAGINGAVAAAALSGKGVKVAIVDRGDFAGTTSSNSSNLAWGGIKYLESHEYFLVSKLCKSRNHLMQNYPSSVKEIRFLTSIQKGFRFPAFLVFLGTLLYWALGRFFTQAPHYLSPKQLKEREPLLDTSTVTGGFEYSDAYLFDNDARFVFNFIRLSMQHGCVAANYIASNGSRFEDGLWHTTLEDQMSGQTFTLTSKVLINAAGAQVDQMNERNGETTNYRHLFSKGIHLIVNKIASVRRVLTFFASDGRLFFAIPMGNKTCIGTTDTQVDDPLTSVLEEDRQFVIENINLVLDLEQPLTSSDIISERCGVRPLAIEGTSGEADWEKLSRKHVIETNHKTKHLSIFGGKLTDCINVGNEIAEIVATLGVAPPNPLRKWYGEPCDAIRDAFMLEASTMDLDSYTSETSSEPLTQRLWRRYGNRAFSLLDRIKQDPKSAKLLIKKAEYLRCEIELTAKQEMITKLDDFLRRRSKISLVVPHDKLISSKGLRTACEIFFGDQAEQKLQEYINQKF